MADLTTGKLPVATGATQIDDSPFTVTGDLVSTSDTSSGIGFVGGLPQLQGNLGAAGLLTAAVGLVTADNIANGGSPAFNVSGQTSLNEVALAIGYDIGHWGQPVLAMHGYGGASSGVEQPLLDLHSYRGVAGTPTALQSGDNLAEIDMTGHPDTGPSVTILASTVEVFDDTHNAAQLEIRTVDTGSESLVTRLAIDGSGNTNIENGKLITAASATGLAGFSLPPGTAPTSPANGDLWTTSAGLYARINGTTVGPLAAGGYSAPTLGSTLISSGATVTDIEGLTQLGIGGGTVTGTLYLELSGPHGVVMEIIGPGAANDSRNKVQLAGNGSYTWVPAGTFGDGNGSLSDTGLSRISAAVVAVGNGSQGDFSGALKLTKLTTAEATAILHTSTTITGGTTGNTPTLTAGPVTGNPTKWLPYDDNGTTRYIPAW